MARSALCKHGERKNSRLVAAFDVPLEEGEGPEEFVERWSATLAGVAEHAAGLKIGLPVIASLGLPWTRELLKGLRGKVYLLADVKLADVAHVSLATMRTLKSMGFDGVVAHAFVGLAGGLLEAGEASRKLGLELFSVVAMSHPGAEEVLNKSFDLLVDVALKAGAVGLVVPATMPKYIAAARAKAPEATLISPGVGAQGARPGSAVAAGSDFEIVGRAVFASEDPVRAAKELREALPWSK